MVLGSVPGVCGTARGGDGLHPAFTCSFGMYIGITHVLNGLKCAHIGSHIGSGPVSRPSKKVIEWESVG